MPIISVEQQVKSELDNYITASKLDFEEDPMNWWKSHNLEYPLLARLAKKYLCACATSLPSERLFSTSLRKHCDTQSLQYEARQSRHVSFPYKESLTFWAIIIFIVT